MRFCFVISHVPDKELVIADTLSRATGEDFQTEVEAYLNTALFSQVEVQ